MYHIPGCPFSERVEILLALKDLEGLLADVEIDISKPRPDWLLRKTQGTTSLPVLELDNGETLKESMVIMRYLEDRFPQRPVAQRDPYRHAVESMLCATDGAFTGAGYRMILNRDRSQRDWLCRDVDAQFERLDRFLCHYSPDGACLFEDFGWAEVAFAPMFKRLWFLELMKLYYDYSQGGGNGRIPEGRKVSSFTLVPHWRERPMPPRDKWGVAATDVQLGLIGD
jgi:glutathione S-transferase